MRTDKQDTGETKDLNPLSQQADETQVRTLEGKQAADWLKHKGKKRNMNLLEFIREDEIHEGT